ncbi:Mpv17-like protein [Toxocara canis]|uniref:Mitochondrial inner membrane protein Mpv17 n=1 Tax=Toxocara canis TaxID=6265 RepID=A0A0B2VX34_TOXCA|nr:Mpv17-like protein [Toxocara canis]
MWQWYLRLMEKRPFLTQIVTSGILGLCGDGISQKLVEKRRWDEYDPARAARFLTITGAYIAPVLVCWFRILERVTGNPKTVPLKRLFIDQTIMAPPFNATILFNLRLLEGETPTQSYRSLKRDFLSVWIPSLMYWPFVQMANFYVVPLNYRVIVVQVAALLWNTFLSYRTQAASAASASQAVKKEDLVMNGGRPCGKSEAILERFEAYHK